MKCRVLALIAVVAVALAQYNAPYSESELRDLPTRYGNAYFETINPVGTAVLLQNQQPNPGFDQASQTEWLTIYDTPASTIAPQSCGNGIREGYELCDLLDNWANNPTCVELGYNPGAGGALQVACTNDCTWDHQEITNWACGGTLTASPEGYCGDGIVQSFENCDYVPGSSPVVYLTNGATCESLGLGFTGGILQCNFFQGDPTIKTCGFDYSKCTRSTPGCGDGVVQGVEQCDPPGSLATCASIGLPLPPVQAGQAVCSPTCDWDVGFCQPYGLQTTSLYQAHTPLPIAEPPLCGNNQIDIPEQCDGTNLQGQTCSSLGFVGGNLNCSGCRYDIRGCSTQGGLVTVAAIGPNVTEVAVGDVVALDPSATCISFALNNYIENRNGYCLVDQSAIAVTLQEGNLFFDKSDISSQQGFRNSIPVSGDLGSQTNF